MTGTVSPQELTVRAAVTGLTHPRSGRRPTKSEIHLVLHNPIYAGEFGWKGKLYPGQHTPIISRRLFEDENVFEIENRPRYKKHQHAFTGLMTCGLCGCAMTAEVKKGRYVYYHCTGFKGRCGNTWVREEDLSHLFADAFLAWGWRFSEPPPLSPINAVNVLRIKELRHELVQWTTDL